MKLTGTASTYPLPVLLARFPKLGAAAVHFVGCRPGGRDARARRAVIIAVPRAGLVVNSVPPGRAPAPAAAGPGPRLRQVEPETEQGMRAGGDVGREHDGLAVFHLAG